MKFCRALRAETLIRAALLIAGGVFAVLGILGGEAETVLRKAVYICLECIGIG